MNNEDSALPDSSPSDYVERSDLEDIEEEVINIDLMLSEIDSIMSSVDFEKRILRILTYCLKNNWKCVRTDNLAGWLKVDKRMLEEWLDKNPKFVTKRSDQNEGVVYCSLASIEKVFPMSDNKTQEVNAVQELPKVGTSEFDTLVTQILSASADKIWRTAEAIAEQTKQPKEEVVKWLDSTPSILRRPGKDKVYYALLSKVEKGNVVPPKEEKAEKKKDEPKEQKKTQVVIKDPSYTLQEMLAFGMLHSCVDQFIKIMNFYANRLATRHEEAFAYFTKAQKQLLGGVALLQRELKIDDAKLPELDQL